MTVRARRRVPAGARPRGRPRRTRAADRRARCRACVCLEHARRDRRRAGRRLHAHPAARAARHDSVGRRRSALLGGVAVLAAPLPSSARRVRAALIAAAVLGRSRRRRHRRRCRAWDRELLASGAYKYAPYMQSSVFDAVLRAGRLEYYKEGAAGNGHRSPADRHAVAGDRRQGGRVERRRHADAAAARPAAGAAARAPAATSASSALAAASRWRSALAPGTVQHADVVEISPEVVEASRFFDRENGDALARVRTCG